MENLFWYLSWEDPYEGRDLAEFWASGPKIWNDLKSASGYDPTPNDTVVEIGCGVGRPTRALGGRLSQRDDQPGNDHGTHRNRGRLGRRICRVLRLSASAGFGCAASIP